MFNKKKKDNGSSGTAVFIDEIGAIKIRVFEIKENLPGEKLRISFGEKEEYIIDKKRIRSKRCIIYKTADGKVIVQNPDKWRNLDLKGNGIKELRFNLQNFDIQEGKSAIHRWTLPEGMLKKFSPIIKLLMICIVIGVLGWAVFKFVEIMFTHVTASRILDCRSILPSMPNPLGINQSGQGVIPLGV